jgi:hypothetical protein
VLGAGASKPYGFPTGAELRDAICRKLAPEYGPDEAITYGSIADWLEFQRFGREFNESQLYSIDAFLARRPEFSEMGKRFIARILIGMEHPDNLLRSEDHWYSYLWNSINDSWEGFARNLRIITFNYDRSLETYLARSLRATFNRSEEECIEKVAGIPILHVYGDLGGLGPLDEKKGTRPFGHEANIANMRIAVARIRIVEEQRHDDCVFEKISEYWGNSHQVCFLGFGYDKTNVNRLRLTDLRDIRDYTDRNIRILGTTKGLEMAEVDTIKRSCSGVEFAPMTCEKFLRTYGVVDWGE